MRCEICKIEIDNDHSRLVFQKSINDSEVMAHTCCYQENFLFEVWNALSLGIKYESQCGHVDYTSRFNPATFTPQDVAKAVEKQMRQGQRQGQRQGGRKWWRR